MSQSTTTVRWPICAASTARLVTVSVFPCRERAVVIATHRLPVRAGEVHGSSQRTVRLGHGRTRLGQRHHLGSAGAGHRDHAEYGDVGAGHAEEILASPDGVVGELEQKR